MKVPSKVLTLSAVGVAYFLMEDMSTDEQNAVANWLMLVAQTLSTNAFFEELNSNQENNNYNEEELLEKIKLAIEKEINSKQN